MHSIKLFGEGDCRVEWEGMKSWASGECVFSQVDEHAGSRPAQFMLSSPAAGVVIVIDWVCCSRHFVFFQLSIGCPWNFFFLLLCFSSNAHKHGRWGKCMPISVPASPAGGEPALGLPRAGRVQRSVKGTSNVQTYCQ